MLRAEGLAFAWPRAPRLLDGIGFELRGGELAALVGANGSGKSTLLQLLAGLLRPDSGRVEVGGRELDSFAPLERARALSYLPQRVRPLYALTVREMVELARHPWREGGDAKDTVDSALAQCDVLDLEQRRFDELSGGERQRVLLAGALAQGGSVLLLDEPTAALDLPHAVSVFSRLREQLASGRSALVVTHDLNLAAAFADRILLLHAGGLLADGPPVRVLRQEILDEALGPGVEVITHPLHGQPRVLPLGKEEAP